MDARHLQLLRELADRGSIAAVAAATHRTPSAVSQQLRTAARDLGVKLIEPSGRGVRLTEAGQVLAEAAGEVETALARAQARVDDLRSRPSGTVRVTALPSACEYLVPPVLTALRDCEVQLRVEDQDVAEDGFAPLAGDVDIVIGHSLRGPVPAGGEQLSCQTLCREPIDVALPAGHPLAARASVRASDVIGETWVGVPAGYPFDTILRSMEQTTGRAAHVVQRVRDNRVSAALVAAGLGVALLPRFTTSERSGVVMRTLSDLDTRRWVVAMSRPDRAERAAVRLVLRELVAAGRHTARLHRSSRAS